MTRYEIAMLQPGLELDEIIHFDVLRQPGKRLTADEVEIAKKTIGVVNVSSWPYSRNTGWAKVAQLHLTQRMGEGTLLLQDIYDETKNVHHHSGAWVPHGNLPGVLTARISAPDFPWIQADTEEMVICRLLLLVHFGF